MRLTLALPLALAAGLAFSGTALAVDPDQGHGEPGTTWIKEHDQACYCLPLEERLAVTRDESARTNRPHTLADAKALNAAIEAGFPTAN